MTNHRSTWLRLLVIAVFASASIAFFVGSSLFQPNTKASSSGPTPTVTGAPNEGTCVGCHGDFGLNSGTGSMTITGLPKNYLPNQEMNVTVTLNQVGAVIFGFEMTTVDPMGAFRGSYTLPSQVPPRLQLVNGVVSGGQTRTYVEHTVNGIVPTQFDTNSWTFKFTAPSRRFGKLSFYAAGNAANSDGSTAGDYIYTTSAGSMAGTAVANFDGDTKSDISVWRPSNGTWYTLPSSTQDFQVHQWGLPTDILAPGDYDGDGRADRAVWRPSNGSWYIYTAAGAFLEMPFGQTGDIPVAADYDGDLKTDVAVFRPSNSTWYMIRSSNSVFAFQSFGTTGDRPMPADYDGDAKTDIGIFRPSNSTWYYVKTTDGSFNVNPFGATGDEPVQGDFDGDGRWDIAVYRPSNSVWYFLNAEYNFSFVAFGAPGDKPAPSDIDGDGKTDVAVFRNGVWYFITSSDGVFTQLPFGTTGDIPVARGYVPQ